MGSHISRQAPLRTERDEALTRSAHRGRAPAGDHGGRGRPVLALVLARRNADYLSHTLMLPLPLAVRGAVRVLAPRHRRAARLVLPVGMAAAVVGPVSVARGLPG